MTAAEAKSQEYLQQPKDVLRIENDPTSDLWRQCAEVEADIFIRAGYVSSASELAEEYEPYLSTSQFILAERNGAVGGAVRNILHGPAGFKTLNDIRAERLKTEPEHAELLNSIDLEHTLEVGTLGVAPEFRGGNESLRLSTVLFGAIDQVCRDNKIDWVLASFDVRFFRGFKMIFDPSVTALGPATDYMGSPTVPALIHVPTLERHTEEVWPDVHATMREAGTKLGIA